MGELLNSNAGIFIVPAVVGTLFFLLRLVLMLAGAGGGPDVELAGADGVDGLDGLDGLDGAHGSDGLGGEGHHGGLEDSSQAFKIVSLQGIAGFVMGFGWGGLGAYAGLGWDLTASFVAAVAGGAAILWLLTWLMRSIVLLQASGNLPIGAAVGREGRVYVTVPARRTGRGKVRVVVGDRARIFNAVTEGEPLATGAAVRVTKVGENQTVVVTAC